MRTSIHCSNCDSYAHTNEHCPYPAKIAAERLRAYQDTGIANNVDRFIKSVQVDLEKSSKDGYGGLRISNERLDSMGFRDHAYSSRFRMLFKDITGTTITTYQLNNLFNRAYDAGISIRWDK